MQIDNNESKGRLANIDESIDIMLYGQPDLRSARIEEAIKRRRKKVVNKHK